MKIIKEIWAGQEHKTLSEKLKLAKKKLKDWNITEYGLIDQKIEMLEERINTMDRISNDIDLSNQEIMERKEAQQDLWL